MGISLRRRGQRVSHRARRARGADARRRRRATRRRSSRRGRLASSSSGRSLRDVARAFYAGEITATGSRPSRRDRAAIRAVSCARRRRRRPAGEAGMHGDRRRLRRAQCRLAGGMFDDAGVARSSLRRRSQRRSRTHGLPSRSTNPPRGRCCWPTASSGCRSRSSRHEPVRCACAAD